MDRSSRWEKVVDRFKDLRVFRPMPSPVTAILNTITASHLKGILGRNQFISIEHDRTSNGLPTARAHRKLHKGLAQFQHNDAHIDKKCVHRRPTAKLQQNGPLFNLPTELLQSIARDYLPCSSEAALALTCHQMADTIGTIRWKFHDSNHPFCTDCELFDMSGHNEDIYGVFKSSKERFLELLARDMPIGTAAVCHDHGIVHRGQLKADWGQIETPLSMKCDTAFKMPMGISWSLRCADIQSVVLGLLPAEKIHHYASGQSSSGKLPADVAVYGKVVGGNFILAMQFRVWVPPTYHEPDCRRVDTIGECPECYKTGMKNVNWLGCGNRTHTVRFNLPLESDDPADWHGKAYFLDPPPESDIADMTIVRVEYEQHNGVVMLFDIFSDLGRGYRSKAVLGCCPTLQGLFADQPGLGCDCEACEKRRKMETIFLEHFDDHEQRLDALRPGKLWDQKGKFIKKARNVRMGLR